jgi:hypothetical protein
MYGLVKVKKARKSSVEGNRREGQWQAVMLFAARGRRCTASAQWENMHMTADESHAAGVTGFQRRPSKRGGAGCNYCALLTV